MSAVRVEGREVVAAQKFGQFSALTLLFAAGVVNFFDRTALSIANTSVRDELHLNAAQMGWLLSAFSLAYGVAQLPLVEVLRRKSTRSVLGVGLTVWSTAQLLTGLVHGLPSFLCLRALLGVGEAPFYPCGVQAVRDWFAPRARGRATAVMSMSQTIGLAAAPPVLTWLMLRLGWRMMFGVLGIAGLAVAAAWLALYRAPAPVDGPGLQDMASGAGLWGDLLKQRLGWGMMLGWGGINYTVWLYTAWLPGYLQTAHGISVRDTGWIAAIPFLGGAAGMFSSGFISDTLARHGKPLTAIHRRNLVTGMICSAASTWIVARSGSVTVAVTGISAALFFIHYAGTSGWGYVQTVVPSERVASLGALQNFASFVIASAAPIVTGTLLDKTHSFTLALAICTGVTLLGALSYGTLAAPTKTLNARL